MRIRARLPVAALGAAGALALTAAPAMADPVREYEVTITNLTSGQPFSPPVVATHQGKHLVFDVGEAASVGVREIAENGNNAPLLASLAADPFGRVSEFTQAGGGPLVPDGTPGGATFPDSVTFAIGAERSAGRLSFATMLVCTNDGFTGVDSLKLPNRLGKTVVAHTAGYDAGTEVNTEDFAHLVPPCQELIGVSSGEPGTGVSDPALAEGGVIAHHEGIQGGSDLLPEVHGWTDPVARIEVERVG